MAWFWVFDREVRQLLISTATDLPQPVRSMASELSTVCGELLLRVATNAPLASTLIWNQRSTLISIHCLLNESELRYVASARLFTVVMTLIRLPSR
ncbi:hypothetical protein D3C85_1299130 [compost metagenome]